MPSAPCHAEASSPVSDGAKDARDLILRVLTVKRVAAWCGVSESAVHQWLHRGSPSAPVPAARVPVIAGHAASEGIDFDVGLLWPIMAGARAEAFLGAVAGARS